MQSPDESENRESGNSAMKFVVPISGATIMFLVFVGGQLYNRLETLEKKVNEIYASGTSITRIEYKLQTLSEQVQEIREVQRARAK